MLGLLILIQTVPDLMADHARMTRAEIACHATADGDEIVVCALRDADRYRVPYITPTAGDPRIVDVPGERARLIARPNNCEEKRLDFTGCGMVGASMTAGNGRGVLLEKARPLAP
jgi:hypothetical protein